MAPINPPWRFDPLQMPVNVNWGGGKSVFVCVDVGGFAFSTANTSISFLDPNPQGNYPGGYNVFTSSDGINWTIQRQGMVDTNPGSYWASTKDAVAGSTYNGTMTIFNAVGGAFTGTPFLAVISEVSGSSTPPPELQDGYLAGPPIYNDPPDVLPFWANTDNPLLFQYGVTGQTSFASEYGFWNGDPDFGAIAPTAHWHIDTELDQTFVAWNFFPGPITTLDGISEYMMSSSVPLRTFVIGANGNNGGSGYTVPIYFRSSDGVSWTQFTPPFSPRDPWFPFNSDVWFDDGAQRTQNEHPGQYDGAPTLKWFSSNAAYGEPVWQSDDGCVTWHRGSYLFGPNPATGNTDNQYVGDPNNSIGPSRDFFGQLTTVYGKVNTPHGPKRMGVQLRLGDPPGPGGGPTLGFCYIHAGPAENDPSTWPLYEMLAPPNAITLAETGTAFDQEEYDIGIGQTTEDLRGATAELGGLQELLDWAVGVSWAFVVEYTYYVALYTELVSRINARLASEPSRPTARATTPRGLYVAYATPPGSSEGIFVCAGVSHTQTSDGRNIVGGVPCFWYSKDAVTWNVANYDYTYTADPNNGANSVQGFEMNYLVSGNAADQLFPVTPSSP